MVLLFRRFNYTICLWLCGMTGWERDYVFELLPFPHFLHVGYQEWLRWKQNVNLTIPVFGELKLNIRPRVIVYNIENSGADGRYTVLYNLLANNSKVAILVHTADEFGGSTRKWKYGEGTDAYPLVPLVLRQYSVAPYRGFSKMQANVVQIPLGYIRGMFKFGNTSLTSLEAANKSLSYEAVHRNLSWSFVGTIAGHRERPQMIEAFQDWDPHEIKTGLDPQSMREVYTNSKFVLVGRGQSSLDCYRVYEAVICGSVPVIVGSDDEVRRTFEFEGDFPPLVSSRDYKSALALCKAMTNEDIDNKRHELISWYKSRLNYISRKIDFILTVFPG